jgi:hypothetical protein
MSTATMVIGQSGTGKSTAMRNFNPAQTLLIQVVKKPLPFRAAGWSYISKDNPTGNMFVTDDANRIVEIMNKTKRKTIVIDDFQYLLANEYMRRSAEAGFQKFTEIGKHAWDVLTAANNLPDDVRVYILTHSEQLDSGHTKAKTIGKLLDEKITVEGLFTIVLKTDVVDGEYTFTTRNNGRDTVKSPMGLFTDERIPNDLNMVDEALQEYYGIPQAA